MTGIDWVWLIALVITHILAYLLGRGDGQEQEQPLSEEARIALKKYEIDKQYNYIIWKEERSGKHE